MWLCLNREINQKVAMKRFKEAHTDPEVKAVTDVVGNSAAVAGTRLTLERTVHHPWQVMRLALREIRLLKASQHPNVVQLLEAFRSKSGRVYIVMVSLLAWGGGACMGCRTRVLTMHPFLPRTP